MKTEIRNFCDEYAKELEPFATGLKKVVEGLGQKTDDQSLNHTFLRLQEVSQRTEALSDKISQQRAYLLIFGPLKSGKSTLMNAISGAYVSEVSSLPAYPALVYVKHGDTKCFQATTYAGEKMEFSNSREMAEAVLHGHEDLAGRILEVEKTGESFDPQQHFPDAIRRMDVETPAQALEESGSVIVDTPGLYTRMRFGYDLMTKDFRDTASCAIFVVKSDNLLFEKVFEEFNQLLGHFSRIFLVVNIDASKRDLNEDGTFVPSLESTKPEAIVDAFQSLAMSAPLREAYERGNLNVYTIDLLRAASKQLKKHAGIADDDNDSDATSDDFKHFLSDLTEYLNSSNYLTEFMYDNLRMGETLLNEASAIVAGDASEQLQQEISHCEALLTEANTKLGALEKLSGINWNKSFEAAMEKKNQLLEELGTRNSQKLGKSLNESLDQWMESIDSLKSLQDDYLNRHIEQETAGEAKEIVTRLKQIVDNKFGGAQFSMQESTALEQAGLQLEQIVPGLLDRLGSQDELESTRLTLNPEAVPMKRSFADLLLFRKNKTVRERVFGSDNSTPIPMLQKQKRISAKELQSLRDMVNQFPEADLPEIQKGFVDKVLGRHCVELSESVKQQLARIKTAMQAQKTDVEAKLQTSREIQTVFKQLMETSWAFEDSIDGMRSRYHAEAKALAADQASDGVVVLPN